MSETLELQSNGRNGGSDDDGHGDNGLASMMMTMMIMTMLITTITVIMNMITTAAHLMAAVNG